MSTKDIHSIRECWTMVFPALPVSDRQLSIWLVSHDVSIVRKGITRAAVRSEQLRGVMSEDYVLRFASAVMNRLSGEQKNKEAITI